MSKFLRNISKGMLFSTSLVAIATSASSFADTGSHFDTVKNRTSQAVQQQSNDLAAKTKEWNATVDALKETIKKLKEMDSGQPGQRMSKEYRDLIDTYRKSQEKIQSLRPQIAPLLVKSLQARKTIDKDTASLANDVAQFSLRSDDYHTTYALSKQLLEKVGKEKQYYLLAGQAARSLDRYSEAKELLKKGFDANDPVLAKMEADLDKRIKLWTAEQKIRSAEAQKNDLPRVQLETTAGTMVIELYENEAPNTVANFVNLVETGYYDGLTFHRVLPGFMAQGGCPDGTGAGGPGYNIDCECNVKNYRRHFAGTLSMAHAGPNTGGSQFFITFGATPHLDGRHTAFGRVIQGAQVLPKFTRINPGRSPAGVKPTKIIKAKVVRKRKHAYQPKTRPAEKRGR